MADLRGILASLFQNRSLEDEWKDKHAEEIARNQGAAHYPSLRDAAEGGFHDLFAINNPANVARDLSKQITDTAELMTPLGIGTSAQDAQQAWGAGDYFSAALAALGAIPGAKGPAKVADEAVDTGRAALSKIKAYHGSPHEFEKFSADKLGTGEGAQAYGHGLYFADKEDVAKTYGKNVYEVDINADPASFIDHDKPMAEQGETAKAFLEGELRRYLGGSYERQIGNYEGKTAGDIIAETGGMNQDHVAEAARKAGVPGVSYLDQESRGGAGTSRNYVVFDPENVNILRGGKLSQPVSETWKHGVSGIKLNRPLEEMSSTFKPTSELLPRTPIDPQSLQGGRLVPFVGDRTRAGGELTHINEQPLSKPVNMQGGSDFMRGPQQQGPDQALWASEPGRVTTQSDRHTKLAEKTGQPIYATHLPMGLESGDFAKMTTQPALDLMRSAEVPRAVKQAFDVEMAEKVRDWPGIDKVSMEWFDQPGKGGARATLAKLMDQGRYQRAGFPDIGSIRKAVIEPELLNVPSLHGGYNIGKLDPGRVITDPAIPHDTYSHQFGGQYLGGLEQSVPPEILFSDVMSKLPPGQTLPHTQRKFELGDVSQDLNQQWVDNIMRYLEQSRQGTSR